MATFTPSVFYLEPRAALAWLERAFGFETSLVVEHADGQIGHAEMSFEGAPINVGGEWADPAQLSATQMRSPRSVGEVNTQSVEVRLGGDLDAHCERARAAGAVITREPEDQFFGARTYRAQDCEGHVWTFARFFREVSNAEMEAATGLKMRTSLSL